jgi:GNAT superfamily N-acetyltransferase
MGDYFQIQYKFNSYPGVFDETKFITTYRGDIYNEDENGFACEKIGKTEIIHVQLMLAAECGYIAEEIFESQEILNEVGRSTFDTSSYSPKQDILDYYDTYTPLIFPDLCIISRLELLPEWRGNGLGRLILKDIYNRFRHGMGLIIAKMNPIQFRDLLLIDKDREWFNMMKMDKMAKDYEAAYFKLKGFFKNAGFDHIEGYDDLMFLNPLAENKLMDEIED